jgi:DNA-binding transcriptional LysR family regulator
MSDPKPPTLDQIAVFLAVVEGGSFSAAAKRLKRANSVISYQIANLETQLGIALFERGETRRPRLTEAGEAVLSEARSVWQQVDGLLATAKGLSQGLEAEVSLAVDVMLPTERLAPLLHAFQAEFPTVSLRLQVEALGAVAQSLLDRTASIGVSGPLPQLPDGLDSQYLGNVTLVPVAAPSHPLALQGMNLSVAEARRQVQLVLTDRSPLTKGQNFAVIGMRSWRVADLWVKHMLIKAGIGWGSLPAEMVADDLREGRLVALGLDSWRDNPYRLQLLTRSDSPPGPAGRWLMERLISGCPSGPQDA